MFKDSMGRRNFMKGLAGAAATPLPIVPAPLAAEPPTGKTPTAKSESGDPSHGRSGGESWFVRTDPSWVTKLSKLQA